MSGLKKTIALIMLTHTVFTSIPSKARACAEGKGVVLISQENIVLTQEAQFLQHHQSDHSDPQKTHSDHCHCANQVCCAFIVVQSKSILKLSSLTMNTPLLSVVLMSWVGVPPTRPPVI